VYHIKGGLDKKLIKDNKEYIEELFEK